MAQKTIYVSDFDMKRLMMLIDQNLHVQSKNQKHLHELKRELGNAHVVAHHDIPRDIITMNSVVRLKDLDTEEITTYTLVFPSHADASSNKISILAPIGTALLGYRVGDVIEWKVPAGKVRFEVEEIIYQPESSGDYQM